jgi:hypothetical protein
VYSNQSVRVQGRQIGADAIGHRDEQPGVRIIGPLFAYWNLPGFKYGVALSPATPFVWEGLCIDLCPFVPKLVTFHPEAVSLSRENVKV